MTIFGQRYKALNNNFYDSFKFSLSHFQFSDIFFNDFFLIYLFYSFQFFSWFVK